MPTEQFSLTLADGSTIKCSMISGGSRIGYIAGGPGSFYFSSLESAKLLDIYTFITSDAAWTYINQDSLNKKDLSHINAKHIKENDHLIIEALKEKFPATPIDGFGFSAPGALLIEEALNFPEDYDRLIFTGLGLVTLDPTFTTTTKLFDSKASTEKRKHFKRDSDAKSLFDTLVLNYQLQQNHALSTFFAVSPTSKLPLKPAKKFLTETIAMRAKMFYDATDLESTKEQIKQHWYHNPLGEHIDKNMQELFFTEIYPQLTPLESLKILADTGKSILLIMGEQDFVTPLTSEITETLQQYPNINLQIIKEAAHVPYLEQPERYREAFQISL
jgi:pimeloyl-ACP methyl ester carboxylesterase